MIRIMLVDDHVMLREALRVVLEQDSDMQVVAEVGDGETALRTAEALAPDVVVMDIAMPGLSGIETTRRLLAKQPNIKVLALSTYLDRRIIQQMLEIAARLQIAPSTVNVHRRNLMRKLGVHKAVDLAKYAIRAGLIVP